MNGNCSTTKRKRSERLPNAAKLAFQWNHVDWKKAEAEVNRLQARIAKATKEKKWNTVKRLQYLLTHSYYAKLLAVQKVTTNKGKNTPGIDKQRWSTPAQKMWAVLSLTDKNYKASPLRRVYIDKKNKKAKRPLGIPTMYDRAMQALYALALDPVAETAADPRSFGFRKGRCCQDACEYIFADMSRRNVSPQWVLEGDIKGCFDHISHQWLIDNIPMDKSILKQFLKAGFVFQGELFPTEAGTPQGGIISPILANMALDGMQKLLSDRFHTNRLGKVDNRFRNAHKVNLVRYADDFIVTAATKEIAEEAKELIRDFLKTRGLELSEEKTLITHIDDGFDMLGWTFRKFNGKLIVKPSKKSLKAFTASLSETILGRGKAWKQNLLIEKLNQQIRGWTNYHRSVCASEAFTHIDYVLYELLWRWAKRRHPHKGKMVGIHKLLAPQRKPKLGILHGGQRTSAGGSHSYYPTYKSTNGRQSLPGAGIFSCQAIQPRHEAFYRQVQTDLEESKRMLPSLWASDGHSGRKRNLFQGPEIQRRQRGGAQYGLCPQIL